VTFGKKPASPSTGETLGLRLELPHPIVVNGGVSIDKESNGIPEFDSGRRTTKVNLWMIVAVGLFFVFGIIAFFHFKARHGG
jgi:hypothetical protein